jgi:hypothetical protein
VFYTENSPNGLADAVLRFEREEHRFHPPSIQAWARRFDRPRFEREIIGWLRRVMHRTEETRRAEAA